MFGTGGGPAWTPRVTRAFSGIGGGASGNFGTCCGAAELGADAPNTAAPNTAGEAARTDLREIADSPFVPSRSHRSHMSVRLGCPSSRPRHLSERRSHVVDRS